MISLPIEKLKEELVKDNLISAEDFDAVVMEASRMGQQISDILISRGVMTKEYFYDALTRYYSVERANLLESGIDEKIFKVLNEDVARQRRVILFREGADGSIDVAMENPGDLETIEFLHRRMGREIRPFLATPEDLDKGFSLYGARLAEDFNKLIQENIRASLRSRARGGEESAVEVPIVAIIDNIVSYAVSKRASDIHIETLEDSILLRYRIDGVLQEIFRMPKEIAPAILARIKLLGALKIDEHREPQDGRFRHRVGQETIDVRLSIMPTFYGEKVVMRLLPSAQKPLSLEELGFLPDMAALVRANTKKTYGIFLITGPTGSGKTTTMYSIINMLNRPEVNIVTIEDPIEYDMRYVNQTQINTQAGITFASGLRAILRQDPNIIMVGEIRDEETAEISVHSALTGHLVLSSLHTNDAPTAIPRLTDMKIEPFLAAAVLNAVVAQRLVRKVCVDCIYSYAPAEALLGVVKRQLEDLGLKTDFQMPKVLFKGRGCQACGDSGFRGRIGIYEILNVSESVRKLIVDPTFNLDKLRNLARAEGMLTMFEDGLRKAERGITTIEEVLRVIRE